MLQYPQNSNITEYVRKNCLKILQLKYFINIIVPCIHRLFEYYIDCVYEVKCYSYLVKTSPSHHVEGYENEQNFQYHLSYQIRCKTKHMHDSVNVLLYKQYLKKEKG